MSRSIGILAGPTASGKSAAALWIAARRPTVIINADAMQVYRELRVLTARPGPEEEAQAPHALYGVLPAAESCSAGRWLTLAREAIEAAWEAGRLPLLVGGTGLYLKALLQGIAAIPDVPPEMQQEVQAWCAAEGPQALHGWLTREDPNMAATLHATDSQRVQRAVMVLKASGHSLLHWQSQPMQPPYPDAVFTRLQIEIPRELLYARCDARFLQMLEQGAQEEVRALLAMGLPESLPAMRAVGVPELARYLAGECSLEEATQKAQQATRNYAKRQLTWLRHQYRADAVLPHDATPPLLPL